MILLYTGITVGVIVGVFVLYLLVVAVVPGLSVPEQNVIKAEQPPGEGSVRPSGPRKEVGFDVKGTPVSAWLYLPEIRPAPVRPPYGDTWATGSRPILARPLTLQNTHRRETGKHCSDDHTGCLMPTRTSENLSPTASSTKPVPVSSFGEISTGRSKRPTGYVARSCSRYAIGTRCSRRAPQKKPRRN